MKLFFGLQHCDDLNEGVAATIGNFDGVHLGHRALLKTLREQANALQLPLLVVLFEPQPGEFFSQPSAPARLFALREKLQVLKTLEVDYVCCLRFNNALAQMSAIEFAQQVIFKRLKVRHLLIGTDFRFGHQRLGDALMLSQIGSKMGCNVLCYPDFPFAEERVSSTRIRNLLKLGDVKGANACLGQEYTISGRVIRGKGLARQWGIPTANIALSRKNLPLTGVFSVRVRRNTNQEYQGIANIGFRPTLQGDKTLCLEVHLFNFSESVYGERLQIFFEQKVRDEMKFNHVDALIAQIHRDIASVQAMLPTTEREKL